MANEERGIDSMKYRKSTHLAGVDVEAIVAEKGSCNLVIKDAFYAKNIDVSGNKTDGYFLAFAEDVKPMMANSSNRKIIASNLKLLKPELSPAESRNIANWVGMKIDLWFDPSVKMMGAVVGGIKVTQGNPIIPVDVNKSNAILNASKTSDELKANWSKLTKTEQAHPEVLKVKETLKTKLKQ